MINLHDYQKPHVEALRKALLSYRVVKDASDTGTGKTFTACAVADSLVYERVVVVCPKAVIPAWEAAFRLTRYHSREVFVINYEAVKTGNHALLVRKRKKFHWNCPPSTLFIFDEDHKLTGRLTLNARLLYQAVTQRFDVMLLGATTFSSPLQMDAIGYALGLHKGYREFTEWLSHVGCFKDIWGAWQVPKNIDEVLQKIHNYIFPKRGSRMLISDIPDFPENKILVDSYHVDDPTAVTQQWDEIKTAIAKVNEKDEAEKALGQLPITDMLRQRQAIELAKLPSICDLIKSDYASGKHVAVFVNFRETLDAILTRLSKMHVPIAQIHGTQNATERQSEIESFQQNKKKIIVSTISAGGVGISLHDTTNEGTAPRSSIISPSFSAVELRQTLGRIHRSGQKSKSLQRIIFASGSIEDKISAKLRIKLKSIDTINDTDLTPF
jgi:SNF2 family DNA or RNA helicase